MKRIFLIILIVLSLTACSPGGLLQSAIETPTLTSSPSSTPTITPTSTQTYTPTPTFTPTETFTPTPTATETPLPAILKERVNKNYLTLVIIQSSVELLEETAERVNNGELQGFESFGALLVVGVLLKTTDEAISNLDQLPELSDEWTNAIDVLALTRDIFARWYNDEINSGDVLIEILPLKEEIDTTLQEVESILGENFGVEEDELRQIREETVAEIRAIFDATPTP